MVFCLFKDLKVEIIWFVFEMDIIFCICFMSVFYLKVCLLVGYIFKNYLYIGKICVEFCL